MEQATSTFYTKRNLIGLSVVSNLSFLVVSSVFRRANLRDLRAARQSLRVNGATVAVWKSESRVAVASSALQPQLAVILARPCENMKTAVENL